MKRPRIEIRPDTQIARLGGRPPRGVLALLIVEIGLFVLYAFADGPPWVATYLVASAKACWGELRLYQPLSTLFVHLDTRGLFYNALSLWIFGSALERWWGTRRFLLFWLVTGAVGATMAVCVGLLQPTVLIDGPSGATLAMILAVAVIFPHHLTYFFGLVPLKVRVFALALGIFLLVGTLVGARYLEAVAQGGGALAASLMLYLPRRARRRVPAAGPRQPFRVIEGGKPRERRYLN